MFVRSEFSLYRFRLSDGVNVDLAGGQDFQDMMDWQMSNEIPNVPYHISELVEWQNYKIEQIQDATRLLLSETAGDIASFQHEFRPIPQKVTVARNAHYVAEALQILEIDPDYDFGNNLVQRNVAVKWKSDNNQVTILSEGNLNEGKK